MIVFVSSLFHVPSALGRRGQTKGMRRGLMPFQTVKKSPILSLRGPERAVAISQNWFDFPTDFGEFETACTGGVRAPRPTNINDTVCTGR